MFDKIVDKCIVTKCKPDGCIQMGQCRRFQIPDATKQTFSNYQVRCNWVNGSCRYFMYCTDAEILHYQEIKRDRNGKRNS